MLEMKAFVVDSSAAFDLDSIVIQTPLAIGLDWNGIVDLLKQVVDCGVRSGVNCPDHKRVREAMTPDRQA